MHLASGRAERWTSSSISMRQTSPLKLLTPKTSETVGAVLLTIALLTLAGRIASLPDLTSLYLGTSQMAVTSALGFVLTGAALLLPRFVARRVAARIANSVGMTLLMGSAILAIGLSGIIQAGVFAAIDAVAARISPTSILGFFTVGALFLAITRKDAAKAAIFIQCGTALLAGIGTVGVLSYAVNLDYLYLFKNTKPIALSTAILFLLCAISIWGAWRGAAWNKRLIDDDASQYIYRSIDVIVTVIVLMVALISFGLSQGRSEQVMLDQMTIVGKDKRDFFETVLQAHLDKALQISSRPAIVQFIRENTANGSAQAIPRAGPLVASAASFIKHGFSGFSYTDLAGVTLASAGEFVAHPEQRLPLAGPFSAELLWDDGYVYRLRVPIEDDTGRVGFILTEQRLVELTAMHRTAISQGETGDLVVCGMAAGKQNCFPFRWRKKSGMYNAYLDGKPLPLTRAISGETATDITTDFRRQRVMAALGPIGATGLGMAVKRDMVELYKPVRRQFFSVIPFLILLVGAGIWVMRIRVYPLVAALNQAHQQMTAIALTDNLTELPNRILFNDRLEQAIVRARRNEACMAVMYIDLDHFKFVNDTFGHAAGDATLKWFADCLKASVRNSDTVARLGGDEFTVILENLSTPQDGERVARAILARVTQSDPGVAGIATGSLNASIGITYYHQNDRSGTALLDRADAALYAAKKAGRGRYAVQNRDVAPGD